MTNTDITTRRFTSIGVLNSLRKAVDTYGEDWVDPNASLGVDKTISASCMNEYAHEGKTRYCIAAWVVQDLLEEKPDFSQVPSWYNIRATVKHFADGQFTPQAIELLSFAQQLQDKKTPWGAIYTGVEIIHTRYLP